MYYLRRYYGTAGVCFFLFKGRYPSHIRTFTSKGKAMVWSDILKAKRLPDIIGGL